MFAPTEFELIAQPVAAFLRRCAGRQAAGYDRVSGDRLEGEAREVAADQAALARGVSKLQAAAPGILSGGEFTVTIRGQGRGGRTRNSPWRWPSPLKRAPGVAPLAAETDGTDGGAGSPHTTPAGAAIDPSTLDRARWRGLDPAHFLLDNDSTGFFAAVSATSSRRVRPGPT